MRNETRHTYVVRLGSVLLQEVSRCALEAPHLVVRVVVLPHKLLVGHGRNSEGGGHDVVYLLHETLLLCPQSRCNDFEGKRFLLERIGQSAQDQRVFPQFGLEKRVERAREGRMQGLGIDVLGNDAVLLQKVDGHVPLATITDKVTSKGVHGPIVERPVRELDGEF